MPADRGSLVQGSAQECKIKKRKEKEAVQEMQDINGKPFVQNITFVLFGIS